jgi:hypothetical protein
MQSEGVLMTAYIVRHSIISETTIEADSPEEALAVAQADLREGADRFDPVETELQVIFDEGNGEVILLEE